MDSSYPVLTPGSLRLEIHHSLEGLTSGTLSQEVGQPAMAIASQIDAGAHQTMKKVDVFRIPLPSNSI